MPELITYKSGKLFCLFAIRSSALVIDTSEEAGPHTERQAHAIVMRTTLNTYTPGYSDLSSVNHLNCLNEGKTVTNKTQTIIKKL